MSLFNPLQKYYRQPKVYVALPSKGVYYPEGSLQGDSSNIPIFGMTGMDEIIMKTPDALFNGDATVKVVQSCCPYIKDAWKMPSTDVDALLVAIRIATYGSEMDMSHVCPNCQTVNDLSINLSSVLEYYSSLTFDGKIEIDDLVITIRPLRYEEITKFNMENYRLQKTLMQLGQAESAGNDEESSKLQDEIYRRISEIQVELFIISIENVQMPEAIVDDEALITDWLKNSDRDFFKKIKDKLETNKKVWDMPEQKVVCSNCSHESSAVITMDQVSFFGKS